MHVEASGFFVSNYDLAVRPRQAVVLSVELAPRLSEKQEVEVRAEYTDLDPGQTGSARLLTRQQLDELPWPARKDVASLTELIAPGATLSHDNFIHFRGNELSLHQFINGVSFLDNPQVHFSPAASPQIFDSVNFLSGGLAAEFGNRFGGVMDIATRSGRSLDGHGSVNAGVGTALNRDLSADYGGAAGRWGYYCFASTSESGRYLNPPIRNELHDIGYGVEGTA